MVAIQQPNYLNIELPTLKVGSIFKVISAYITMARTLNSMRKILKFQFNNFEAFIKIYNLDTPDKVDNILIKLENMSEQHNISLNNALLNKWYAYPLYYLVDRIEDWNMALQGLLMSLDVELVHQEKQLNDN